MGLDEPYLFLAYSARTTLVVRGKSYYCHTADVALEGVGGAGEQVVDRNVNSPLSELEGGLSVTRIC